ncbi:MAG: hypothetical protein IJS28_11750 [Synergistaceae bacterium]|nr:hypothetical protein [Synergistaceae bacterium]
MKRTIIILALLAAITISTYPADADTLARDALIAYSGTEAFTKLEASERQACMEWLVRGGTMTAECSSAVMKLVSQAPDAVTPEQRQALIAEASGRTGTASAKPAPVPETSEPQISKKNDDTGKIVAVGLLGVLAGLIIHNNVRHHKSSPSYTPEPPRPAPQVRPAPPHANRPPQAPRPPQRQPQPRPVNAPRLPRR